MAITIISGTSNPSLSQAIASHLGLTLGNCEITRFLDSECRVYLTEDVKNRDVVVIQSLSMIADQRLVELCLIGQAAKECGARSVTAVIPWMGYSKQDKAFRKGEAISAQFVAKCIEVAGFDRVVACELHSETVMPYFSIPVLEVSTHAILSAAIAHIPDRDRVCVISPDTGGKSRSERFAVATGLPIVYLDKTRDKKTGEVTVTGISGSVERRPVVIFDDIINTAATAIKTSEFLYAHHVSDVYFLATHAVFAGSAVELLEQSPIRSVVVTDTIAQPASFYSKKISVVSVSSILADAIKRFVR